MTSPAPLLERPTQGAADELDHIVCCQEDIAICGTDTSGLPWTWGMRDGRACIVCADLEPLPCRECGR